MGIRTDNVGQTRDKITKSITTIHELRRIKNLMSALLDVITALNGGGSAASNLATEPKQNTIINLLTSLENINSNLDVTLNSIESINTLIETNTSNSNTELTTANTSLSSIDSDLSAILTELQLKADLTETQPVETQNGINTLSASNSTTTGTITGAYSASFFNDGAANVTVAGASIAPGLSISFEAEPNHTLDTINYDATGSSILITIVNA